MRVRVRVNIGLDNRQAAIPEQHPRLAADPTQFSEGRAPRSRRRSTTWRSRLTRLGTSASSSRVSARCIYRHRLAEHVESVLGLVAPRYVLPLLILDDCRPRVSELETAVVGDIDEERKAIRVRPDAEKNQRYRYLNLPDDLFAALVATLPPREDRDAAEPLFPGVTDATLRMAIAAPAGTVVSRTSRHTGCDADADRSTTSALAPWPRSWNCSVTQERVAADHYVYALVDYREIERRGCPRAPLPLGQTCLHGACTGACPGASQLLIAGMFDTCTAHSQAFA